MLWSRSMIPASQPVKSNPEVLVLITAKTSSLRSTDTDTTEAFLETLLGGEGSANTLFR